MWKKSPVTLTLIISSILVGLISQLGNRIEPVRFLFFSEYVIPHRQLFGHYGMPEIFSGQIWRIFTPMFLHFGILHIVFNMLWLRDLGGGLEYKLGRLPYLLFILIVSALSNFGQFWWSGPSFGGMSGVVYGLLGYLWIRGKTDPYFQLQFNTQIVVMMIIWFFLCLTGLMGNIANTAHGVGLLVGMAAGYVSSPHWKKILKD